MRSLLATHFWWAMIAMFLVIGNTSVTAKEIDGYRDCSRAPTGRPICYKVATDKPLYVDEDFYQSYLRRSGKPQPQPLKHPPKQSGAPVPRKTRAVSPEQIFATVSNSVVTIVAVGSQGQFIGLGSGVVVKPEIVATNCHVLQEAAAAAVVFKEAGYEATVVDSQVTKDLCLLSVAGLPAKAVKTRATSKVRVGQKVFALGAPHGLELTFSEGMVSSLRPTGEAPIIQTTAPISPGSSGGALLSNDGSLIGITTMQMNEGQNLNFAIPADWIWDFRYFQ